VGTLEEGWSAEQRVSHGERTQGTLRYIFWPPRGFTGGKKSSFDSMKGVAEAMGLPGEQRQHPASQPGEPGADLLPAHALHASHARLHAC
jgi:hypothetical protein